MKKNDDWRAIGAISRVDIELVLAGAVLQIGLIACPRVLDGDDRGSQFLGGGHHSYRTNNYSTEQNLVSPHRRTSVLTSYF